MRRVVREPVRDNTVVEDVPPAVAARRRGRPGRREVVTDGYDDGRPGAAATVAGGAGSLLLLLARLVRFVTGLAAAIIVAAILLRVFDANTGNSLVSTVHDIGRTLVGPFDNIFKIKNGKVDIAVNWGLAAVVWLAVGAIIAGFLTRAGLAGAERSRVR